MKVHCVCGRELFIVDQPDDYDYPTVTPCPKCMLAKYKEGQQSIGYSKGYQAGYNQAKKVVFGYMKGKLGYHHETEDTEE
jgi:hypothetical protein